jgi:hypothetical protein
LSITQATKNNERLVDFVTLWNAPQRSRPQNWRFLSNRLGLQTEFLKTIGQCQYHVRRDPNRIQDRRLIYRSNTTLQAPLSCECPVSPRSISQRSTAFERLGPRRSAIRSSNAISTVIWNMSATRSHLRCNSLISAVSWSNAGFAKALTPPNISRERAFVEPAAGLLATASDGQVNRAR